MTTLKASSKALNKTWNQAHSQTKLSKNEEEAFRGKLWKEHNMPLNRKQHNQNSILLTYMVMTAWKRFIFIWRRRIRWAVSKIGIIFVLESWIIDQEYDKTETWIESTSYGQWSYGEWTITDSLKNRVRECLEHGLRQDQVLDTNCSCYKKFLFGI